MSILRRSAQVCLANTGKVRGGGVPWKGAFWSDGSQEKVDGFLFNETPPPPGQSRRLESWEVPYWGTVAIATAVMTVTFWAKADVGPYEWAEKQARRELQAEGLI